MAATWIAVEAAEEEEAVDRIDRVRIHREEVAREQEADRREVDILAVITIITTMIIIVAGKVEDMVLRETARRDMVDMAIAKSVVEAVVAMEVVVAHEDIQVERDEDTMTNRSDFTAASGVSIAGKWVIGRETVRTWTDEAGVFIAERMVIWRDRVRLNSEDSLVIEVECIRECTSEEVDDDERLPVGHEAGQVQGKDFKNNRVAFWTFGWFFTSQNVKKYNVQHANNDMYPFHPIF